MKKIHTERYSMLEVFAKSEENAEGYISIKGAEGEVIKELSGKNYFKMIRIPLSPNTEYEVTVYCCNISLAYLSGCDNILDHGICYIDLLPEIKKYQGKELSEFYDTPYREQYHFVPFKNWGNDPNGLCWYKGYYHLYYQQNPHEQKWGNMYWGHAASKDLVHWVHLPIALEPQENLKGDSARVGGAFSGSAVVEDEEVVFYFTRHYGPLIDCEETLQWQAMVKSSDALTFQKEADIITEKPEGVGYDFRDPKVIKIHNIWYMVLAGNLKSESAILLYKSADSRNWEYAGPLVIEPDKGSTTFECPDFFFLDGKYIALGALMRHTDENGRYQMTRCYIGDLKNDRLKVEQTQWFDFGSNCYAVQSFEHKGRRIAIGWISDFYGEHILVENGAYGSYTIPRELHLKNNILYMEPVPEIYELLETKLYEGRANTHIRIDGNSYYAKILFKNKTDFDLVLGETKESSIHLVRKGEKIQIVTKGTKTEGIHFQALVETMSELEIFVDRRVIEVYINKGEAVGTKLFYTDSKNGVFKAEFETPWDLEKIEIYSMKSIW